MNNLPPWRLSLAGALHRNRSLVYSRYLQLATIFCLLLLEPQEVDHLELKGEPQNRTIYSYHSEQGWLQEIVNP